MVLSATEITTLRALTESFFPDSVEVLRRTLTSDNRGGSTTAESVVATVRGKLRTTGNAPVERQIAERIATAGVYAVDLPYATSVLAADVLRLNGARRLEVVGMVKGGSEAMTQTAICQERT